MAQFIGLASTDPHVPSEGCRYLKFGVLKAKKPLACPAIKITVILATGMAGGWI